MKITKRKLKTLGACETELSMFCAEWPRGGTVNKRTVARAVALGLNLYWLAAKTLKDEDRNEFMFNRSVMDAVNMYSNKTYAAEADYLRVIESHVSSQEESKAWRRKNRRMRQYVRSLSRIVAPVFLAATKGR